MPDLNEQEFRAQLGLGPQPATDAPPPSPAISLTPLTESELATVGRSAETAELARPRQVAPSKGSTPDFATRMGARPGIPFDTVSGVPTLTRLRMDMQPTDKETFKMLQDEYGAQNVRRNDLGMPIVSMRDEKGKLKDVLAKPLSIDWDDTMQVVSMLPELAGVIGTLVATKGRTLAPGVWNAIKTLALTAAGGQAAGALKDVAVRSFEGEPINPSEIAGRRAGLAAQDVVAGGLLGAGGYGVSRAISPFSHWGPLQQAARASQKRLAEKYGVDLGMTPAESTGSGILQAVEALESQQPGAKTAFRSFIENRWKQFQQLQDIMLGGAVPEEEAAGQKLLASAGAKLAPAEMEVERAASGAIGQATAEIESTIGPKASKTQIGKAIRAKAEAERTAFKTQDNANYDAFYNHPLAQANIVDADALAKPIQDLIERFPTVEELVTKQSKLFSPSNQPISIQVPEERVLAKSIPSGIQARLEELASTSGGKVSISSLKQIRTDIANAIAEGEAIPGVKPGYLKAAEKAVTDAIDAGLRQINDPQLTQLWKTATAYHKANRPRFEQAGIAEIFHVPKQPNYLGDSELVSRLSEGKKAQDTYAAYKSFFGATSPELRGIQQSIADDVLARSELAETIDAKGFIRRLEQLERDAPEAFADVFGPNGKQLRSSAMAMVAAQGENLPKEELAALMRSGNLSAAKLSELMSAQAKLDQLYRNDLFRDIAKGNVKAEKIQPTEVVNRLVFNPKTQPSQLRDLVALLNDRPDILEDLRRLTFKRVLDDATIVGPNGARVIGANELEANLANENLSKRLRAVLGASTFEDLSLMKDFLKPGTVQQQAMKSAGGLVAGSQITGMVERGEFSYVARALKNFLLATIYTGPKLRAYFANTALSEEGKALIVNSAIVSAPMVEALMKTYTAAGARAAAGELSRMTSLVEQRNAVQQSTPGTGDIPWDQFIQRLNR